MKFTVLITKSLQKISNKLKTLYTDPRIVLILIVENVAERDETLAKIVEFVSIIELIEVYVKDDKELTIETFSADKDEMELISIFNVL